MTGVTRSSTFSGIEQTPSPRTTILRLVLFGAILGPFTVGKVAEAWTNFSTLFSAVVRAKLGIGGFRFASEGIGMGGFRFTSTVGAGVCTVGAAAWRSS